MMACFTLWCSIFVIQSIFMFSVFGHIQCIHVYSHEVATSQFLRYDSTSCVAFSTIFGVYIDGIYSQNGPNYCQICCTMNHFRVVSELPFWQNRIPFWLFGLYFMYVSSLSHPECANLHLFSLWGTVSEKWPNFLFGGFYFLFAFRDHTCTCRPSIWYNMSKFMAIFLYDAKFSRYNPTSCLAFSAIFGAFGNNTCRCSCI